MSRNVVAATPSRYSLKRLCYNNSFLDPELLYRPYLNIECKIFHFMFRLRQRKDLQMWQWEVSAAHVFHLGRLIEGRQLPLPAAQLQRLLPARPACLLRGLPWPRHSHGNHVKRRCCHGCSTSSHRFVLFHSIFGKYAQFFRQKSCAPVTGMGSDPIAQKLSCNGLRWESFVSVSIINVILLLNIVIFDSSIAYFT